MGRLDVMDEVREVWELDSALVELANVQKEDCHLSRSCAHTHTRLLVIYIYSSIISIRTAVHFTPCSLH